MARKVNRASFGSIRKLPSGRFQARYPDLDGAPMNAPMTFDSKTDAERHIATVRADRTRGAYIDPRRGERLLSEFGAMWIENGGTRGKLAPRTRALYTDLFERHISPTIGKRQLGAVSAEAVRSWRTALLRELAERAAQPTRSGGSRVATGEVRVRQAYSLLRSIMATAEADGAIAKNPCQISGAGAVRSPERPLLSMSDYARIVDAHPPHLRPALHLTLGAHLRLGELVALQRRDLDLAAKTLRIERQIVADGQAPTPTKTGTATTLDLPKITVDLLREHLRGEPKAMPTAPLFTRPDGRPLTRAAMHYAWKRAREATGIDGAHLHDLRHAGLTLAAQGGATSRELMQRARHTTSAAAMVYQHVAQERGKVIAAGLDQALRVQSN